MAHHRNHAADTSERAHFDVIVVGGGQSGLTVGYHLARLGLRFAILDASERVGDSWRSRWDSLRLFTPAKLDGLVGMPFPAPPDSFPTKDEMADYLESYARRFELPVWNRMRVERLTRAGDRYEVHAGGRVLEADHVVIAMATYQQPKVPDLADRLGPAVVQLHSSAYRGPGQLQKGDVLVVGAGNSGAEIALELSGSHRVLLSGRDTGQIPFRIDGLAGRLILVRLVVRFLFHRILTVRTPLGRAIRPKILSQGGPLIRTKRSHLARAGVETVPKVTDVHGGRPVLEDGRVVDVANVVWCTGYHPGFSWIDLPVDWEHGAPVHSLGVVAGEPGLYLVGLHFLHAVSSNMIHAVDRDARHVVDTLATRLGHRRLRAPRATATPTLGSSSASPSSYTKSPCPGSPGTAAPSTARASSP